MRQPAEYADEAFESRYRTLFSISPRSTDDERANHGYHTQHLLHAVGAAGHVHAFEPNPTLAAELEAWTGARLKVHQVAVGASPSVATLHVPVDDDGWGSLVTDHMEPDRELITFGVDVERIDSFLCPGDAPTFVKLDVEGFELEALRGAGTLFGRTELFVVEVAMYRFIERPVFHEVVAFMAERGYLVYDIAGFIRRPYDGAVGLMDLCFARTLLRGPEHEWHARATETHV